MNTSRSHDAQSEAKTDHNVYTDKSGKRNDTDALATGSTASHDVITSISSLNTLAQELARVSKALSDRFSGTADGTLSNQNPDPAISSGLARARTNAA